MSNQYRLKLEIKLKHINYDVNGDNYVLNIKVLKKDNRFDVKPCLSQVGKYKSYSYSSSKNFTIHTNSRYHKGFIGAFSFCIPNKKYLNRNIEYRFRTDLARKTYLEYLHKSILEWSNNWESFDKEPSTKFKAMNNKWYFYITK